MFLRKFIFISLSVYALQQNVQAAPFLPDSDDEIPPLLQARPSGEPLSSVGGTASTTADADDVDDELLALTSGLQALEFVDVNSDPRVLEAQFSRSAVTKPSAIRPNSFTASVARDSSAGAMSSDTTTTTELSPIAASGPLPSPTAMFDRPTFTYDASLLPPQAATHAKAPQDVEMREPIFVFNAESAAEKVRNMNRKRHTAARRMNTTTRRAAASTAAVIPCRVPTPPLVVSRGKRTMDYDPFSITRAPIRVKVMGVPVDQTQMLLDTGQE